MGLNPPFGVKASLANKFIDKALTFKPKLIVLIVPKETKRYVTYSCCPEYFGQHLLRFPFGKLCFLYIYPLHIQVRSEENTL
jgi:hypothetical protein